MIGWPISRSSIHGRIDIISIERAIQSSTGTKEKRKEKNNPKTLTHTIQHNTPHNHQPYTTPSTISVGATSSPLRRYSLLPPPLSFTSIFLLAHPPPPIVPSSPPTHTFLSPQIHFTNNLTAGRHAVIIPTWSSSSVNIQLYAPSPTPLARITITTASFGGVHTDDIRALHRDIPRQQRHARECRRTTRLVPHIPLCKRRECTNRNPIENITTNPNLAARCTRSPASIGIGNTSSNRSVAILMAEV